MKKFVEQKYEIMSIVVVGGLDVGEDEQKPGGRVQERGNFM